MRKYGVAKPHVRTVNGGYHHYLSHSGYPVSTVSGKNLIEFNQRFPCVDIRGEGGCAIFCGHMQRGTYEWLREMEPDSWGGPLIEAMLPFLRRKEPAPGRHIPTIARRRQQRGTYRTPDAGCTGANTQWL